jgi:hypothetical protein
VMVLGCSRKAARFLTFRSSSRIWAELHEKAFRRLGGASADCAIPPAYLNVLPRSVEQSNFQPITNDTSHHGRSLASICTRVCTQQVENPCHIIEGTGLTAVS